MAVSRPPLHRRVTFAIMVPVLLAGLAMALAGDYFLTQPLVAYLHQRSEARLRLASGLALGICEALEQNLASSPPQDQARAREAAQLQAQAQLGELRQKFPRLQVLALEPPGRIVFSTLDLPQGPDLSFFLEHDDQVRTVTVGGDELRYHGRPFPQWGWHLLTAMSTADYLATARRASYAIYGVTLGMLVVMLVSLVLSFHWLVNRPLRAMVAAAGKVAQGDFTTLEFKRENELGQLGRAFNSMLEDLGKGRRQLDRLLEKLGESEEAYRSLAERSLALITIVQDGDLVYANPRAVQVSGFPLEELLGSSLLARIHPDDRQMIADRISRRRDGEWTQDQYEFRFVTKEGQTRWMETLASPLTYHGRPAVLGVGVDITERKLAEQEQTLLRERLQQSQKMEVLGTLAGGVSHDFNNLLQIIDGYAELLAPRLDPESPEAQHLRSIVGASQRGAQLIQQLLAFSRRAEGKPQAVSVNQEILQTVQILERTIPRMVRIQSSLQADLPPALVDPNQLEQVLLNLANNARDAMPQGGALRFLTQCVNLDERYCRGLDDLEAGLYVLIRVSDNGHGMDKQTADRVFEPFFTTKASGQGTGLGLATAYGVIRAHRGHITCYSEPGQGSTFNVYLPVAPSQPAQEQVREAAPPLQPQGGSETILVVDDEPALLDIASQMLSDYGYRVLCAGGGEEALAILDEPEHRCRLVILDLNMPGMGGGQCLRHIGRRYPWLPVIISTGYAGGSQEELIKAGARAFLAKPYSLRDMLIQVRAALEGPEG